MYESVLFKKALLDGLTGLFLYYHRKEASMTIDLSVFILTILSFIPEIIYATADLIRALNEKQK
jgi:hypothetical protein